MMPNVLFRPFREAAELEEVAHSVGFGSAVNQISRGNLTGDILVVKLRDIIFIRTSFDKVMTIQGAKVPNFFMFGLTLGQSEGDVQIHGQETSADHLYGMNPDFETYLKTSPEFSFSILLVPKSMLLSSSAVAGREEYFSDLMNRNWLRLNPEELKPFKEYLQQIYFLAEHKPKWLQSPTNQRLIQANLLPLLINVLQNSDLSDQAGLLDEGRIQFVKLAEQWIHEHIDEPITLEDVYSALNVSRRTLIYSFKDVFNLPPMTYIKVVRLNGVRRRLLKANPQSTKINLVAQDFGFWSGGHFARDYKNFFGETPSQTLAMSSTLK